MLSCITCSKSLNDDSFVVADEDGSGTQISAASREAIRNLAQLSRAHGLSTVSNLSREGQLQRGIESEAGSERAKPNGGSPISTPAWSLMSTSCQRRVLGDMHPNTLKNGKPMLHTSSGPVETMIEKEESKEMISQVEPGVLITLVSLRGGGNELKRIRFSREFFSEGQAQHWWAENYDKIMTLYNVQAHDKDKSAAVPTIPKPDLEEVAHIKPDLEERDPKKPEFSPAGISVEPPIEDGSLLRRALHTSITSSSRDVDRSGDLQSRDKSVEQEQEQEQEQEWVEEYALGVYVVIHCSLTGLKKIKRLKFSREKFNEMQARLWWEENRVRIHEKYI